MIEAFAAYIKTIAAFLIFSVMAELVTPDNGYKKYMQVVLGFLMVLIILQPIQKIFTKYTIDNLAESVEEKVLAAEFAVGQEKMEPVVKNAGMVTEIYKQKLSDIMLESLKQGGIPAVDVKVTVKEDEEQENYGSIQSVLVVIGKEEVSKQKSETWTVEIEPVVVAFPAQTAEKATGEAEKKAEGQEQITRILLEKYGVEKENITIRVCP